jgi:hypothetical protein
MPLQLPNLDDRKYNDLVEEARMLIPTHAPEWTNHNPSDPGVTLVELFAYLAEMLIYRLNRVTDPNVHAFLRLLNGPNWAPSGEQALTEEIRDSVLALRRSDRVVTCKDFESLALAADPGVARAHCLPRRNLESENPLTGGVDRPGHISVVIVPVPKASENNPQPAPDLIQSVKNDLEPRRLLTTRVHVVGPRYFTVGVRLTLVLKPDASEQVQDQVVKALQRFLHPLDGGPDERGWPFGRNVYVSEIYQLLDTQPGVDYVTKTDNLDELIVGPSDAARLIRSAQGELVAVEIHSDELVDARIVANDITLIRPERS